MGVFHGGFCILIKPAFCIGVLRRSSLGLAFFPLSLDTIHFGVLGVLFSHHHGSGDLPVTTIKSLNGSRFPRVHQRKRISTYRTTCGGARGCGTGGRLGLGWLVGWLVGVVFSFATLVFSSFAVGGYIGANISERGRVGKDIVRFLLWNLGELVFFRIGSGRPGRGLVEELVDISCVFFVLFCFLCPVSSSSLVHFPPIFWLRCIMGCGGRPRLASTSISLFLFLSFFPVWISRDCISDMGFFKAGKGGDPFAFACLGSLGFACLEASFLFYFASNTVIFVWGLVGLGWQSISGNSGAGVQWKRCCCCLFVLCVCVCVL